ncbi:hypothetical protein Sru01_13600 [Sphaerisporangium rufum]|uniref:2'-5' RNA ligase family protein n=1 Tax=Sphaerisporangium rufum TaxID=1381558 RepID=A0A919V074_9ACTN|nr:2'-5' RNA ligase family protein [Sphaerisporangium rufum]GII76378.1 hypothetical protein Sru01_13600 [Sphaerisporangium rufum]
MRLEHAPEVRDHWWPRIGWRPGRLVYTWHLTFENAPGLHRHVARYQRQVVDVGGLDPVPLRWLHLTVQAVGWVDEISSGQVDAITDAVGDRLRDIAPVRVAFQRAILFHESIVLLPEPADPLHEVRSAIRDGIAHVLGEAPDAAEQARGFWPHVSIAYVNTAGPAAPYAGALDAIDPAPAEVTVGDVALIVQERLLDPERVYRWTTRARCVLGGRSRDHDG